MTKYYLICEPSDDVRKARARKNLTHAEVLGVQQKTIEFFTQIIRTLGCNPATPKFTCMNTHSIALEMDTNEYWHVYDTIIKQRCHVYISRIKTVFDREHYQRFLRK